MMTTNEENASPSSVQPEGMVAGDWVLVPVTMTEEMRAVFHDRVRILVTPAKRECEITNDQELWEEVLAATPPAPRQAEATVERAVMVCPQCEGEGGYPDGVDDAACHTECTRCGGNGWIVDLAALTSSSPEGEDTAPGRADAGDTVVRLLARFDAHRLAISDRPPSAKRDDLLSELDTIRNSMCRALTTPKPQAECAGEVERIDREAAARFVGIKEGTNSWRFMMRGDWDGHYEINGYRVPEKAQPRRPWVKAFAEHRRAALTESVARSEGAK